MIPARTTPGDPPPGADGAPGADGRHRTRAGERPAYPALARDCVATLRGWTCPDASQRDAQEGLRDGFLRHLTRHGDGIWRDGPPAHLTASCLVLDDRGERVLLTYHRRARAWFQLGGHLEVHDASLYDAAQREAREESGLPGLTPLALPVHLDRHALAGDFGRCREHLDVRYAAVAPPGEVHQVGEESLDVRWWPVTALPPGTSEELGPLLRAALAAVADLAARSVVADVET